MEQIGRTIAHIHGNKGPFVQQLDAADDEGRDEEGEEERR